jgi:hypothetical protein
MTKIRTRAALAVIPLALGALAIGASTASANASGRRDRMSWASAAPWASMAPARAAHTAALRNRPFSAARLGCPHLSLGQSGDERTTQRRDFTRRAARGAAGRRVSATMIRIMTSRRIHAACAFRGLRTQHEEARTAAHCPAAWEGARSEQADTSRLLETIRS